MRDRTLIFGLELDPVAAIAWGALLGIVIGSYLATLVVRARRGPDLVLSIRSRCDQCDRQLRWFELAPVLSYLAFSGRCRTCKSAIACEHLAIEVGCGVIGAMCFLTSQPLLAPLGWIILTLAFYDALYLWLPNRLVGALAVSALIAPAYGNSGSYFERLAAGAIGFLGLWSVGRLFWLVRGHQGLGGGDPKMFGALGLWTGPAALPTLLLVACALGLTDAIRRLRSASDTVAMQLPFGTYLAGSSLLMIVQRVLAG